MDDIFGDPDDLLELYERGKAARGGSGGGGGRAGAELEEAPEPLEGEDGEEGAARQAAFAQRQVPPAPERGRAGAAAQQPCQAEGGCEHAAAARAGAARRGGRGDAALGRAACEAAQAWRVEQSPASVWHKPAEGICPQQTGAAA